MKLVKGMNEKMKKSFCNLTDQRKLGGGATIRRIVLKTRKKIASFIRVWEISQQAILQCYITLPSLPRM